VSVIHLLPDPLVSQIAAGEVVERPASVVKELIENSLDAGASAIEVRLESGGRSLVAVTDDGRGMGGDDALLAFDRHATSKIASFEDLEKVGTLGFRGEALAAIASVARVELTTADRPGEGHRVRIEGGRVRLAEPMARPRGTTIEAAALFFNVPARRKFLKAPETELRRALEVVQGYALARPDVHWRVLHEGRTLLDALPAAGPGGPRHRVAQLFGADLAAGLVELGEPDASAAGERIGGLVGSPATARGRRQFVFVNRRLLRDRAVLAAFYRAVREEWKTDEFPALFLFLDVPPEEVDVNVHPQKAEVRFRDPRLLGRIEDVRRRGLARARGEEAAPLRRPPGDPAAPFAWQGLGGRPVPTARRPHGGWTGWPAVSPGAGTGEPEAFPAGGPGRPATSDAGGLGEPTGGLGPDAVRAAATEWSTQSAGFLPAAVGAPYPAIDPAPSGVAESPAAGRLATPTFAPPHRAPVPLSGRRGEVRPFRLLGQYKATLILLEGPDGLYLVDQHVAHERILYERLRRTLAAGVPTSQILITPALLNLAPSERLRLAQLAPRLEHCGFGLTELSGQTLALTAVPAVLSPGEAEALLLSLAGDFGDGGEGDADETQRPAGSDAGDRDSSGDGSGTGNADGTGDSGAAGSAAAPPGAVRLRARILDALAASLACKSAVKMHHPLSAAEMESLVTELFAAEQPYACPHGRPIVLQMADADLERRFGRR
jgi:DNA mismatch repair protein MutL